MTTQHPEITPQPGEAPCGLRAIALGLLLCLTACGPTIGDSCESSTECSVQGDRLCDTTQPGGYCTVSSCTPDSCPDDTYCVTFFPDTPRLSQSWCMVPCGSESDCRDGYRCASTDTINAGLSERRVDNLDSRKGLFCAVVD